MLKEYEDTVTGYQINHLIEFINNLESFQNPHHYTIIEWFANEKEVKDPVCYELYNIIIEREQGIIIVDDADDILFTNNHALNSFLVNDIVYIGFQDFNNMITITLGNDNYDGYIRIYY